LSQALAIGRGIDQIEVTQGMERGKCEMDLMHGDMTDDLARVAARSGPATSERRIVA
jgi:hypothetical protein